MRAKTSGVRASKEMFTRLSPASTSSFARLAKRRPLVVMATSSTPSFARARAIISGSSLRTRGSPR